MTNPGIGTSRPNQLKKAAPGVRVIEAEDGAEALRLFQNYEESRRQDPDAFPPIVILLDLSMPNMDGFSFLEAYAELKNEEAPSSVQILTSSDDHLDRVRAGTFARVEGYLTKPLTRVLATGLADRYGLHARAN